MTRDECEHGHLRRSCEICELRVKIEILIRKYEKRSMYGDGGLYWDIIDDLQELLGK